MEQRLLEVLSSHELMAVATNRADGWPQVTMVVYVHEGFRLYFVVSRQSQKFANLARDDRISVAIGDWDGNPNSVKGMSLAGHASEVKIEEDRDRVMRRYFERHPGLAQLPRPDLSTAAALIRVTPKVVSLVDFQDEHGHTDTLRLGDGDLAIMAKAEPADWGLTPTAPQETKSSGP